MIGVNGELGRSNWEASKDNKRQRYGRDTGKVDHNKYVDGSWRGSFFSIGGSQTVALALGERGLFCGIS